MRLERGTIVVAILDPTAGHEQRGQRPFVVVSDPEVSDHQRFPMICLVPLTSTPGTGALYPAIDPGARSGLSRVSYALVDQMRTVDKRRICGLLGRLGPDEWDRMDSGIRLFLAL